MNKSYMFNKSFESRFQVYLGAAQLIPSGVGTRINFDTVQFDPLDEYDEAVLYQFVPQQAGYYLLRAGLGFPVMAAGTIYAIALFVDAVQIRTCIRASLVGTVPMVDIVRLYYLTPANTVWAQAYQVSGVGQNLLIALLYTYFEGFRVG